MLNDKTLDSRVAEVLNSSPLYYQMLQQWHDLHDGLAVEATVKKFIEMECRPGAQILEAGSGTGAITNWFAAKSAQTQFVGVDISQIGVSMAREKAPPNAEFRVSDLKKLPFADGTFNFIFSQSVLEHVVGWETAISELRRVLVSGGRLLLRLENAGVSDTSRYRAFFNYLLHRNKTHTGMPTFELEEGDWDKHERNFDVEGIPSDVLVRTLRRSGFSIAFFTTGTSSWRDSTNKLAVLVSYLNFFPFNHLGAVTIILGKKVG